MSPVLITFLMLSSLIGIIILGYPVAFVLGGLASIFGFIFIGPEVSNLFMLRLFGVMGDYILLAIPLFVFMGVVIEKSGLAARLYDAAYVILGRLRGGLAIATLITCTIFAAATGVIGASVVTMGLMALPSMIRYNYDKPLATGVICAGGTLGILIPPSVLILIYGPLAGLSVGRLFMAAFMPGLLLASLYVGYVLIRSFLQPDIAPSMPSDHPDFNVSIGRKFYLFATSILPVGVLILAVLGSIFFGVAAPTEAAGVGAFASLILAACYKQLTWKNLKEAIYSSMTYSAMIYLVLIAAGFFTAVFLNLGGGKVVENIVLGLPLPNWGILLVMFTIIFILGAFIDWIGTLMIGVPLFTPIAAAMGYDPIWFAMMFIVVMQTSFLTPPFAYAIFYLKGIAPPEVTTGDIYRGVIPFILLQIVGVLLLAAFPQIALWLPSLMN
ncbi:TRAP transporter large permease subunit [Metallumcola ferriviriculae]|uniref:TRAP transporter large permease subunit n=1 Tax=Metallumcola ferriviriculae TaxID=3039180 RepID=A0AAU0UP81_9FIRM|nr:TRAP transporter large permease subunit [Desulfitibacteraceae bacterium MK1]